MSGYPDPDYAPPDTYPSNMGESCENPKPAWFWRGGTFCTDVTIQGSLDTGTLQVVTEPITVGGTSYSRTLFLNPADGLYYYVLASSAPSPLPVK
jgi:hypothetical protein